MVEHLGMHHNPPKWDEDEETLWVLIDPNGATVYRSLDKARADRDALDPEYRGTIHPVGPPVRDTGAPDGS